MFDNCDSGYEDSVNSYIQSEIANGLSAAGRDLWAEYSDFMSSINDPMDLTLGEIYREKIKAIFRILERNGINPAQ